MEALTPTRSKTAIIHRIEHSPREEFRMRQPLQHFDLSSRFAPRLSAMKM